MLAQIFRNSKILLFPIALTVMLTVTSSAFAQIGGGGGGGGTGDPTDATGNTGGIEIDASGVLTQRAVVDNAGLLNQQRAAAAQATLNKELNQPSQLRKISLTRLEREVEKLVAAGQPVPADMRYLAGMTRVTHVFFYPETKDIVIAGPAEGYFLSADNRVIGTQTGQATLQLQDLIVALRAFAPDIRQPSAITCSIDPTQEGLLKMRDAYAYANNNFRPGDEAAVVKLFRESLGLQVVTIKGVSPKTNFARVLVEADYHMKLIGIGLEQPPVRITSFIEKASPTSVAKNSLQRWFFQPEYECVTISPDHESMQLTNSAVKLVGADESVTKQGDRKQTAGVNGASRIYCTSFTKMYDQLAQRAPLWGELRNLMDIAVVAAFIQKEDLFAKADWSMTTFGDESKYSVEKFNAPSHVAPVANAVWKGNYFMTPIAGGVNIQPRVALNSDRIQTDTEGTIAATKQTSESKLRNLADGQWWWD